VNPIASKFCCLSLSFSEISENKCDTPSISITS
jgi:hypothetical protein